MLLQVVDARQTDTFTVTCAEYGKVCDLETITLAAFIWAEFIKRACNQIAMTREDNDWNVFKVDRSVSDC